MKIHCCLLDRECREIGAPARLQIATRTRFITIALWPSARMQRYPYDYTKRTFTKWVDVRRTKGSDD